jgi:TonB family protein
MGKILKYCNSCEEGFAERFAFCPDCGSPLQAYEMNPVGKDAAPVAEPTVEEPQAPETPEVMEAAPASFIDEPEVETAPIAESAPEVIADSSVDTPYEELEAAPITGPLDAEDEVFDEAPEEVVEEPAPVYAASDSFYETPAMHADEPRGSYVKDYSASNRDDGFYVTVIQEKNGKQRNALLLGSTIFMLTAVMVAWGVSLFQKELGVGSIGDERSLAMLIDEVPMPVEEVEPENKNDDEGGGGGGGGKEEPEPVSQGDLAPQMRNPPRPPDATVHRMDNPELQLPQAATEGTQQFEQRYGRWGDPNAVPGPLSNGPGTGGGMGSGTGTGQGSGRGTGAGSGTGSGYGSGVGTGTGSGTGAGTGPAPPPKPAPVTVNYRIIAKPKATYTDAARTNGVQGNVRLKVTLLASGQIGPITPVTRLPHGLTEQAIAAARQIRFEPKMVNGRATSVVVTVDYGFNIY